MNELEQKYNKSVILEAYNIIKNGKQEITILQEDKKLVEEEIRTKIAEIEGLEDKEGKPNIAKVKAGLLSKAIDTFRTGENKLAVDLDTMETYLKYIKQKEVPKAKIDRYILLADEEKETKSELNDNLKKLKDSLDPEIINAIQEIVKEELLKEKEEGNDSDKKVKDSTIMQRFYNTINELKKLIKK